MEPSSHPPPPAVSFALSSSADVEARSLVTRRLGDYNAGRTGISDETALDVLIVDDLAGQVLGGLIGRTSLGVFFVDYFYLPPGLRKHGHGSRMLAMAEAEAVERGCSTAVLFTMTIQAPAFYEKHGYESFGRIDCDPPGNARVFMHKQLPRPTHRAG